MSLGTRIMTNIFVTLTLVAGGFAVWVYVTVLLAAVRVTAPLSVTARALRDWVRPLAVLIAATCMLGSLYYSEIVGFTPCRLCWYQRVAMYPLVLILGVGLWPPARRSTRWIATPFVIVGAGIALYHWLVERVPSLAETSACSLKAPCSVPWFTRLGFITIAWMALTGFLTIGACLLCEAWNARRDATPDARFANMVGNTTEER